MADVGSAPVPGTIEMVRAARIDGARPFRAPGCYAFRLDGLSVSFVIVMRVRG